MEKSIETQNTEELITDIKVEHSSTERSSKVIYKNENEWQTACELEELPDHSFDDCIIDEEAEEQYLELKSKIKSIRQGWNLFGGLWKLERRGGKLVIPLDTELTDEICVIDDTKRLPEGELYLLGSLHSTRLRRKVEDEYEFTAWSSELIPDERVMFAITVVLATGVITVASNLILSLLFLFFSTFILCIYGYLVIYSVLGLIHTIVQPTTYKFKRLELPWRYPVE